MNLLYSNISFSYERPFNTGNNIIDLLMRNHNWNGAVGRPLEIKYIYANLDNLDDYLTYKDSFLLAMDCSYTPAYNTLAQLSEPNLQELSTLFGTQRGVHQDNYQTNHDLETDFLFYAEDTHFSTQQGSFYSSKQQCEYKKLLLQENFKRLAYCNPEVIADKGIDPKIFIQDINKALPMKPEKYTEIYARTGKYAIEHRNYALLKKNSAPIPSQIDKIDESLIHFFKMISDVANVKMIRTESLDNAEIFLHFNTMFSGAEAIRDIAFFNGHKTHAVFLEGMISESFLNNLNSKALSEVWHTLGHMFIDHPLDNNMRIELTSQEELKSKCSSVLGFGCDFTPIGLMPYDIKVLQYMYTANNNTHVGDTTYKITTSQTYFDGDKPYFPFNIPAESIYTIYDAGGNNTLDTTAAGDVEVVLDLNEGTGHLNKIGNNKFFLAFGTNIHKVELGGQKPQVTLDATVGCEIIVHDGVKDAKIINFHEGQDQISFENDVLYVNTDYGYTAFDLSGNVIAEVYNA